MAQIRAAGRSRFGANQFRSALAPCFGKSSMAVHSVNPRTHCHLRRAATALVPRLSLAFHARGFCRQPVHWPDSIGIVLFVHSDACRLDTAAGRQRPAPTQTLSQRGNLLASGKRIQPPRSAFLKINIAGSRQTQLLLLLGRFGFRRKNPHVHTLPACRLVAMNRDRVFTRAKRLHCFFSDVKLVVIGDKA